MKSAAPDPVSGEKIGRYQVLRELGRGGFARVIEAVDPVLERHVALKLVRSEVLGHLGAEEEAFLLREARAAARLSHPGFVTIYEIGRFSGGLFLAMELVKGTTLRAILRERAQLDTNEALGIVRQIVDALDVAHVEGVVHQDIKPENLLIEPGGRVRIADFGIASLVGAHARELGGRKVALGSPAYMAPEQILKQPTDGRTDIYSVAVVLYEMLAGSKPYRGASVEALLGAILHEQPESMANVAPALERTILRAMSKRPSDRYPTGRAFADALEASRQHAHANPNMRAGSRPSMPPPPRLSDGVARWVSGPSVLPRAWGQVSPSNTTRLMLRLRRKSIDGVLLVATEDWSMAVGLEAGAPTGAIGGPGGDEIGSLLLGLGYMKQDHHRRVVAEYEKSLAWESSERIGVVATRLGAVSGPDLETALESQLDARLNMLLDLPRGTFWFYRQPRRDTRRIVAPRPIERIVANGLLLDDRRRAEVVDPEIRRYADHHISVGPTAINQLVPMGLLALGQPFLDRAQGRTVADSVANSGIPVEVARVILFALWELGGVALEPDPGRATSGNLSTAKGLPPPPPSRVD